MAGVCDLCVCGVGGGSVWCLLDAGVWVEWGWESVLLVA